MAAPKLNDEQKTTLLEWLAAGYSTSLILHWFKEREWEPISRQGMDAYAKRHSIAIKAAREKRLEGVLETGAAAKAERVKRLAAHADQLEAVKWTPAPDGKLPNEKAWRETLEQIRRETDETNGGISVIFKTYGGGTDLRDIVDGSNMDNAGAETD